MYVTDNMKKSETGVNGTGLVQLHAAVRRYCLSLTGSGWDAEDLAQDTWLKAIGTLEQSGHTNPEAFLLRIAKNTWIDQSRRKAVLNRIFMQEQQKVSLPENGFIEIETVFQALLKHLPPLQRTVFLLRDVFGFSIKETAEKLETTEGAVKAAHHRARQSLEAVKEELETGTLPLPEDEELKVFLRTMAAAYQTGDIAVLVKLALYGQVEPAVAVGMVRNRILSRSLPVRHAGSGPQATMRAAA